MGQEAEEAVEAARAEVAALIGAEPREIVLTSGATESNNIAIKGAARHALGQGTERRRVVTVATEHKCVLESVPDLRAEGFEPVVLPVEPDGRLDPARLARALPTPTLLVSVMAVNNETGVIQDIARSPRSRARPARCSIPTRRRRPARSRSTSRRDRPAEPERAQALRAEGRRRALRAPPAPGAARAAVLRRRPGARAALRHAADAAGRRARRGLPAGAGGDGGRGCAHRRAAAAPAGRAARAGHDQRLLGAPDRRQPQPHLPGPGARHDARGAGALRLDRVGLQFGRDRAELCAARARARRGRGGAHLAHRAGTLYQRRRRRFRRRMR